MIRINIKKTRFVLVALAVSIVQQCLVHRYSAGYFSIDLVVLLGAFIAINAPDKKALWAAFFLGMLRDFGSVGMMGGAVLSMLPPVLIVLSIRERLYRNNIISDTVFSLIFLLSFGFIYGTLMLIFSSGVSLAYYYHALGSAALTMVVTPPFFVLLRLSGFLERHKTTF